MNSYELWYYYIIYITSGLACHSDQGVSMGQYEPIGSTNEDSKNAIAFLVDVVASADTICQTK